MAVINSPWVGDARGKLAGGVYFRAKGQTLARGYNPSPLNRRTSSQQTQRALFSSAVRFYSKGVQNLFKFAFEGKPTKESDYNAFMRYNSKLGMYFGPEENRNENFGSLAPWIMTHGSLQGLQVSWGLQHMALGVAMPVSIALSSSTTVSQLSQALAEAEGFMAGDILTFVRIDTQAQAGSASYPYSGVPSRAPIWDINQFILDPADTRTLEQAGISSDYVNSTSYLWMGDSEYSEFANGAVCIHSRISNGQLLVSDSVLNLNSEGLLVYRYGVTNQWKNIVLAAWNSEEESILQGSRAAKFNPNPEPEFIYDFTLPANVSQLTDQYVYVFNMSDFFNHVGDVAFVASDGNLLRLAGTESSEVYNLSDGIDTYGTANVYEEGEAGVISFNTVSAGPVITSIIYSPD